MEGKLKTLSFSLHNGKSVWVGTAPNEHVTINGVNYTVRSVLDYKNGLWMIDTGSFSIARTPSSMNDATRAAYQAARHAVLAEWTEFIYDKPHLLVEAQRASLVRQAERVRHQLEIKEQELAGLQESLIALQRAIEEIDHVDIPTAC